MQVKIGVQNVARELVFETEASSTDVKNKVAEAIKDGGVLQLTDEKGASIIVPATQIGYVELGAETKRRVGFGISE